MFMRNFQLPYTEAAALFMKFPTRVYGASTIAASDQALHCLFTECISNVNYYQTALKFEKDPSN